MSAVAHPRAMPGARRVRRFPLPQLIYEQPTWKRALVQSFARSRQPAVRWRGNVAHVAWRPLGFGLVEVERGEWALAWMRAGSKPEPFTNRGADRQVAQYHLAQLWLSESRPLYPPVAMRLGSNAKRPANAHATETIGGKA